MGKAASGPDALRARGGTPDALRAHAAPRLRALVHAAYEASVEQRGLLAPGGLARALDAAPALASGREPVHLLELAAGTVVVRRLRHGGALGALWGRSYWGPDRALDELRVTAALRAAGAPVPQPAFAIATRRFGPLWTGAVATALEPGARDGLAFLQTEPAPRRLELASAAGRAVRRFHDAGGRHPDLQVKNLLAREGETGLEVCVIDLDRARREPDVAPEARMAELMRLYRSLRKRGVLDRVGPRGLARFLSAYCEGNRPLRSALRARLPAELRRIERHARLWRPTGDVR